MDSETLDQGVREIKSRVETAGRQRARAEYERDHAVAAQEKVLSRLKAEFGVETAADAKKLLAELEQKLGKSIQETKAALDKAEM